PDEGHMSIWSRRATQQPTILDGALWAHLFVGSPRNIDILLRALLLDLHPTSPPSHTCLYMKQVLSPYPIFPFRGVCRKWALALAVSGGIGAAVCLMAFIIPSPHHLTYSPHHSSPRAAPIAAEYSPPARPSSISRFRP